MPECGSQCYLCDLPIRFDTYSGCSHNCRYCFTQAKKDLSVITKHETVKNLAAFIQGKRNENTRWADWNIPLHWGGLSDPLQPVEAKIGNSYECLSYLVIPICNKYKRATFSRRSLFNPFQSSKLRHSNFIGKPSI